RLPPRRPVAPHLRRAQRGDRDRARRVLSVRRARLPRPVLELLARGGGPARRARRGSARLGLGRRRPALAAAGADRALPRDGGVLPRVAAVAPPAARSRRRRRGAAGVRAARAAAARAARGYAGRGRARARRRPGDRRPPGRVERALALPVGVV